MTQRFATRTQLIRRIDGADGRGCGEATVHELARRHRETFQHGQVSGEVVMVDRVWPYDPDGALYMMMIATDNGLLVRAPLTKSTRDALLEFARVEGGRR